jgi:hypothetical protein
MLFHEILPRRKAGDGPASSPICGASQGLGNDLIAYTNADIEDRAPRRFTSIVSTRRFAHPAFTRSTRLRSQYIGVMSAARWRGFASLFGQRRSAGTQSRLRIGAQLMTQPQNSSGKVLVRFF